MTKDFSKQLVKEYTHWQVLVHENQDQLGRSVVWCKREHAVDLADATLEEQAELFHILYTLRAALTDTFQPDWFNYSFLGNVVPHLHCHVMPRYAKPREFHGMTFADKHFGKRYQSDPTFVTSEDILFAVRDTLKEALLNKK